MRSLAWLVLALAACVERAPSGAPPPIGTVRRVAVGEEGVIMTSDDGVTWTRRESPVTGALLAVAWGEDRFVAVGAEGTVIWSADGIRWERAAWAGTPVTLSDVVWDGGRFVAVGSDWIDGTITIVGDGEAWDALESPEYVMLSRLAAGGVGRVVGTGAASSDLQWLEVYGGGADGWEHLHSGERAGGSFQDLDFGAGRFVGVNGTQAFVSDDGRAWEEHPTPLEEYLVALASGPPGFVALGERGAAAWSPDGRTWTAAEVDAGTAIGGTPPYPVFTAAIHDGETFLALAYFGRFARSTDGTRWTFDETTSQANLIALAVGGQPAADAE